MRLLIPAATAALIATAAVSAMAATPIAETRTAGATGGTTPTNAPVTPPATPPARPPQPTSWPTRAGGPAGNAPGVAPSSGFVWPMSPRPVVLRPFEQPPSQWSSGHRGVDLSAGIGQAVLSAGDGIVAFSGVIAGRGVITVRHPGGLRTTYEPVDQRLATATVVHRGARIGVISSAPGHCLPQACLHWGAVAGRVYRDPLSLLGFGRPVLLPLG